MHALPELDARRLRRRILQLALLTVAAVALVALMPGAGDIGSRLADAEPSWLAVAIGLELLSVVSHVVVFRAVLAPRTPAGQAYRIGLAEQAANSLLPAGGAGGFALSAWALRRLGLPLGWIARRTVAFFLITSAANVAALALFSLALAAGIGGDVPVLLALVPAALAAGAIAIVLSLPALLDHVRGGRLRGRVAGTLAGGVRDTVALIRARDRGALVGAAGYLAFDVAVLWAAFRAFGAAPALGVLVVAYLLGQLGALLPVPGGIGGVEGGLIGALVLYGTPVAAATAAVLAYRVVMLWIPAVVGGAAFLRLRRMLPAEPPAEVPAEQPAELPAAPVPLPAAQQREREPERVYAA